mmetsp:Transcript_23313/g.32958  ORF Transcript_23313/g.32958 Transcript_23313/m.32958 type:complete len:295 (-) Transcript_23313:202-1086(-)
MDDSYDDADFGDFDESGDPVNKPVSKAAPPKTPDSTAAGGRKGARLKSPPKSDAEDAPVPSPSKPAPVEKAGKAAAAKAATPTMATDFGNSNSNNDTADDAGPMDYEKEYAKQKYIAVALERERDSLKQQIKKMEAEMKQVQRKARRGGGEMANIKSPTDMGNDDPGHLAQSLAQFEFRCSKQQTEIQRLKALLDKGDSFQVVDLVNAGRDKDWQILELKKEIKQLERTIKINKAAENLKLQEEIRNLHSQIKSYQHAAVESDRVREKYIKKIDRLREEIKMSKMFKYDPSAAV